MKHALKIGIWLLAALTVFSCQKERGAGAVGERDLFVSLDTRAADENVAQNDNLFRSLVFYFFTDDGTNSKTDRL